jgi:hypothetical protein
MRKFYVDGTLSQPEETDVKEDSTYDAKDRKVFVNSHYDTLEEAWEWLDRDVLAQIRLAARERERLTAQLQAVTTEAANAAERFCRVHDRKRGTE